MGECGSVLVVDDDADVRDILSIALETSGYPTSVAVHGQDALAKLTTIERPCLMLVDLMMPVMDGAELMVRLRREPTTAAIPIVVISAFDRPAADAQPDAYLRKPINLDDLLAVVARFCGAPPA
jgi:CheY-like chemotaxis protein